MKLLHTSDWHLGRCLYGRTRYDEFAAFLDWLIDTLQQQQVDALLIAGDVFDTNTPSNRAQTLYYQFLCRVAQTGCRDVIIIAGNHDSPSFLNAPQALLKALNIHVIGAVTDNLADEIIVLTDKQQQPCALVCAVPYLRDRDMRQAEAGESFNEKAQKLADGIRSHYQQVVALACQQRQALNSHLPIIAMGHLFAAGGQTVDGDGVRELYVGSLAHMSANIFPEELAYVALGHLHVPQMLEQHPFRRYSGSPIAMGFGEATQQKSVCLFDSDKQQLELLTVPTFQRLVRLKGDWPSLQQQLLALSTQAQSIWLEIIYDGEELKSDLRNALEACVQDSPLEILRIKNNRIMQRVLSQTQQQETLADLDIHQVFERCLEAHEIPEAQKTLLRHSYRETVHALQEPSL